MRPKVIFRPTGLEGAFLLEPERIEDERGYFARTFCRQELEALGLSPDIVQCSVSFNHRRGTLRGLHIQRPPHQEDKLVRCSAGAAFDAIVDLRPQSPTFRRTWTGVLSAAAGNQVFVPKGLAHGFLTLEDRTEIAYQMSVAYAPHSAAGYRYDDPAFAVPWPEPVRVISQRDLDLPRFAETA